jgi:hypothetical protein
MIAPQPPQTAPKNAPVQTKVKVATAVTFIVGVLIAVLNYLQANSSLLGSLPLWAQSLILVVIPPVLVGLSAYQTTNRV